VYCFNRVFILNGPYLGHIISNSADDDEDIQRETDRQTDREIRNMFLRTNIRIRRFSKCSLSVKTALFKSYCICMYDVLCGSFSRKAQWTGFMRATINVKRHFLAINVMTA